MAERDNAVLVFYDWLDAAEDLSPEEFKSLFLAVRDFSRDGTSPPEFSGGAKIAAKFIFPAMERYKIHAKNGSIGGRKRAKNAAVATLGAGNDAGGLEVGFKGDSSPLEQQYNTNTNTNTIESTPPPPSPRGERTAVTPRTATRFTPPTVDEVRAYCAERGSSVDAQRFVDFYASKGWNVGKSPMKDWKAAVRNWERGERERNAPASGWDYITAVAKGEAI